MYVIKYIHHQEILLSRNSLSHTYVCDTNNEGIHAMEIVV